MSYSTPPTPDLLLEHVAFIRSVARAALRGDDLVDDVVQDTMIAALEGAHRRRGALRPWLGGVARNAANNLIRRRAATRRREERVAHRRVGEATDDLAARAEEGRHLVATVLGLDKRYQQVVLLRYYEGLNPREIANRLNLPLETVRTRVKRALVKLRQHLARSRESEPGEWRTALAPLMGLPLPVLAQPVGTFTLGALVVKKSYVFLVAFVLLCGLATVLVSRFRDENNRAKTTQAHMSTENLGGTPSLETSNGSKDDSTLAENSEATINRETDLHGLVVRSDGVPVAGASVTAIHYRWASLGPRVALDRFVEGDAGPLARTDSRGFFQLPLTRCDMVNLRVEAEGLCTKELTKLQAGEQVRVVLSSPVRLVVLATDSKGAPVAGMATRLFADPKRAGEMLVRAGVTDAQGRVVFGGLSPGLNLWLDPNPNQEGVGDPGWLEVQLPRKGESVYRLELPTGETVRGRVTNAITGESIAGASVSSNWAHTPSSSSDSAGQFELHGWTAALGDKIHVRADGFLSATKACAPPGEHTDVKLLEGASYQGRVVSSKGAPVRGAFVCLCAAQGVLDTARTGADGAFSLWGLVSAPQVLSVRRPGLGHLIHHVLPEDETDLGDLVLIHRCALTGTVVSTKGTPVPRAPITLRGPGALEWFLERRTDDLGRFAWTDLAPGTYEVFTGFRTAPGPSKTVRLSVKQPSAIVQFSPAETRRVLVRVIDEEGEAAAGVPVVARASGVNERAVTSVDGLAYLTVDRRSHELRAAAGAKREFRPPGPVQLKGWETEAVIEVERLVAIQGRLLDPSGSPIASGSVSAIWNGVPRAVSETDKNGEFTVYVSRGTKASLEFNGVIPDVRYPINSKFVPLAAQIQGVVAGTSGLVLRAANIETDRTLRVRVVDPSGKPLRDVQLQVNLPPGRESRKIRTGADGRAQWDDLPAVPLRPSFAVNVIAPDPYYEQPWLVPIFPRVIPNGQEITLAFREGIIVRGRVLKADGAALSRAYVAIFEDGVRVGNARSLPKINGEFTAVLDPKWSGTLSLRCTRYSADRSPIARAVLPVDSKRDSDVVLRLVPISK